MKNKTFRRLASDFDWRFRGRYCLSGSFTLSYHRDGLRRAVNFPKGYGMLGTGDVFIDHSLDAGVGGWSVYNEGFRPKLFLGVTFDMGQFMPLFY